MKFYMDFTRKSIYSILSSLQQKCRKLGHQVEQEICQIVQNCPNLIRLGLVMEFRGPLNKVATVLQRNLHNHRSQPKKMQQ